LRKAIERAPRKAFRRHQLARISSKALLDRGYLPAPATRLPFKF
jgi:hypothetical protein